MLLTKFNQALPRDYVHVNNISQNEIVVNDKCVSKLSIFSKTSDDFRSLVACDLRRFHFRDSPFRLSQCLYHFRFTVSKPCSLKPATCDDLWPFSFLFLRHALVKPYLNECSSIHTYTLAHCINIAN